MEQVRETLGPDAIIVSTHHSKRGRGVQLTAAVEYTPDQEPQYGSRRGTEGPEELERRLEYQLKERLDRDAEALPVDPITDALSFHRAPKSLIEQIIRTASSIEADTPVLALAGTFDALFQFAPLPDAPKRNLMIVGPPGVGKTVTVAKLATRAVLAGAPVKIVTTDTLRAGAIEQIGAFARILDKPLLTAESPDQLHQILQDDKLLREQNGGVDPETVFFIDTPGSNPYSPNEIEDLRKFIEIVDAEPVLVLAAGGDATEAAEIAEVFADLGVRRLIVTRIDTTRRLGSLLAAVYAGSLAISEISITPFIAEGLKPVNPVALSRLFMHESEHLTNPSDKPSSDLNKATA